MVDDIELGGGTPLHNFLVSFSPEMLKRLEAGEVSEEDVEKDSLALYDIIDRSQNDRVIQEKDRATYQHILNNGNADLFATFQMGGSITKPKNTPLRERRVSGGHPLKTLMDVAIDSNCYEAIDTLLSKGLHLEQRNLHFTMQRHLLTHELAERFIEVGLSPNADAENKVAPLRSQLKNYMMRRTAPDSKYFDALYDFTAKSGLNLLAPDESLNLPHPEPLINAITTTILSIHVQNRNNVEKYTPLLKKLVQLVADGNTLFADNHFLNAPTPEKFLRMSNAGHGPQETLNPAVWSGREEEAIALLEALPGWMQKEVAPLWEAYHEQYASTALAEEPQWHVGQSVHDGDVDTLHERGRS